MFNPIAKLSGTEEIEVNGEILTYNQAVELTMSLINVLGEVERPDKEEYEISN